MSQYAEYVRELGHECLETEKGFATFRYPDEKTVYIMDVYVQRDFRKEGIASDIADLVMEQAKARGCTTMIGSVIPSNQGSTRSLQVLLGYGMRLKSSSADFILFEKEIG